MLCRFYEPTSGQILIDDIDYKDRSLGFLRSKIGFVQQTPFIFNGTIKDNIKYGKLDATDEEVIDACKAVDIDGFITSLPNGYDTKLEDGGNELSTGQKQLISFARAIVRKPSIMILDEATANLDMNSEEKMLENIKNYLPNCTVIFITHRFTLYKDSKLFQKVLYL